MLPNTTNCAFWILLYILKPCLFFHNSLPLTLTFQPKFKSKKQKRKQFRRMGDLQIQQESTLIPHKQKQSMIIPPSSMLDHHHTYKNYVKRRSPSSSSAHQPSSKKHSFNARNLTRSNGFSAITLPFSLRGNALSRCVSDRCTLLNQSMPIKGSSTALPPLPPISRCISEVIDPSEVKEAVACYLNSAEKTTPESDSMVCVETCVSC
jgi:hypothetical protein